MVLGTHAQVDRVQNIAMLELVVTLFLGLLLKLEVVNAEEEHSGLFSGIIAMMTAFIFLYPAISMVLTSERMRSSVLSRLMRCLAPPLTTAARARGAEQSKPHSSGTVATEKSGAEHGATNTDQSAGARSPADLRVRPAQFHGTTEAGPSNEGAATPAASFPPAAACDSHAVTISILSPEDDADAMDMRAHTPEQVDEYGAQ